VALRVRKTNSRSKSIKSAKSGSLSTKIRDLTNIVHAIDSEPVTTIRIEDVDKGKVDKIFTFDYVFNPEDDQENVYETAVRPIICIFIFIFSQMYGRL
jgi:hypothetical protein